MTRRLEFSICSRLAAPAQEVWRQASTMAGVNRELWPLARMTCPGGRSRLDDPSVVLGERLFRSWILLFGLIPVDYDDLTIVALEPQGGFLEDSTMLSQSRWQHRRSVHAIEGGCSITDHVEFVPRVGPLGRLYQAVFQFAFRLRHRNLKKQFGQLR